MKLLTLLLTTIVISLSGLPVFAAPADVVHTKAYSRGTSFDRMEAKYRRYVKNTLAARGPGARCNANTVRVRKYWGSMKKRERLDYIKAVKCLYKEKPPRSSPTDVPGARNRYDDFVAAHAQEMVRVHFTGSFYGWHRHLVWLYERALHDECGYRGPSPYWDWTRHADPRDSPVFDGSETSLGGNGEYIPHPPTLTLAFGAPFTFQPGTGGGCVTEGPFTDLTVRTLIIPAKLSGFRKGRDCPTPFPFCRRRDFALTSTIDNKINLGLTGNILNGTAPPNPENKTGRNEGALGYNPRCLTRDLNPGYAQQTRREDIEYLLACPDAVCLLQRADGWEASNGTAEGATSPPLVHTAGHAAIGGLEIDAYVSPGDPVFWLQHAQMDRVWTIWQAQDPAKRTYEIGSTRTRFNNPPSDPVQPDDPMVFGAAGDMIRLGDALSTIDGPYCYLYE